MLSVKRVKTTCAGYGNFCTPVIEISVVKFVTRTNKIDDEMQLELAWFFFLGGGGGFIDITRMLSDLSNVRQYQLLL